jgi:hypothetical protein
MHDQLFSRRRRAICGRAEIDDQSADGRLSVERGSGYGEDGSAIDGEAQTRAG